MSPLRSAQLTRRPLVNMRFSGTLLAMLLAAGCTTKTPIQLASNGTTSTTSTTNNKTTRPLEIAADDAPPTGVHLSSQRPTDARLCVGWGFGCGITTEGLVRCWGTNSGGELGIGRSGQTTSPYVAGLHDVSRIACGETNSTGGNACAITKDGTLSCWGMLFTGSSGKLEDKPVKVLDHIVDVKTSADRACALSDDGTLRCWGANYRGQLGDGTTKPSAVPIRLPGLGPVHDFSLEGFGGCAIGTDGEVRCWGEGPCRPAPRSAPTPHLVPGLRGARWVSSREPLFVINAKGSLVGYHCTGSERGPELTEKVRLDNVVRAYDSVDRLCAVRTDESVHCIERGGLNEPTFGLQLNWTTFTEVPQFKGAKEIALTRFHACASFEKGVRCFGDQRREASLGREIPNDSWLTVREPARAIPEGPVPADAAATNALGVAGNTPAPTPVAGGDFQCPPQPTHAAPSLNTASRLFSTISPTNHWTCLDGTVVGLLVTTSLAVPLLSWNGFAMPAPAQPVTGGNYLFARNNDGFRALYFATPNGTNPLDLQVNRGDGSPYVKFSSMLGPTQPNPWKLNHAAHIVRLRVNDGFGSAGGIHFIASEVNVLDKTKEIPMDPTTVLSGFLTPLATESSPEGKRWRELLVAEIGRTVKRDPKLKSFAADVPQQAFLAGFHATWDEKAEELRVGFYASLTETRSHEERNPDPDAGTFGCHAPPGADCAPRRVPATIPVSLVHRSEYAVRATFSKTGALVKREEFPVNVH